MSVRVLVHPLHHPRQIPNLHTGDKGHRVPSLGNILGLPYIDSFYTERDVLVSSCSYIDKCIVVSLEVDLPWVGSLLLKIQVLRPPMVKLDNNRSQA